MGGVFPLMVEGVGGVSPLMVELQLDRLNQNHDVHLHSACTES